MRAAMPMSSKLLADRYQLDYRVVELDDPIGLRTQLGDAHLIVNAADHLSLRASLSYSSASIKKFITATSPAKLRRSRSVFSSTGSFVVSSALAFRGLI